MKNENCSCGCCSSKSLIAKVVIFGLGCALGFAASRYMPSKMSIKLDSASLKSGEEMTIVIDGDKSDLEKASKIEDLKIFIDDCLFTDKIKDKKELEKIKSLDTNKDNCIDKMEFKVDMNKDDMIKDDTKNMK